MAFPKTKKTSVIACVAGASYLFYFTGHARGTRERGRRPRSPFLLSRILEISSFAIKKPAPATQASSVNLGKTFLLICHMKKLLRPEDIGKTFSHLCSLIFFFLLDSFDFCV